MKVKNIIYLNLPEEERATEAIARILRYGTASGEAAEGSEADSGGGEDVDVEVDDNVDIDV